MNSKKKSNINSQKSLSKNIQGKIIEFNKTAKEKLIAVKNDLETSKKQY